MNSTLLHCLFEFRIFDLINTKYKLVTAIELPIGGNCRYFFNNSTLISKCDSASEIVCSN